MAFNSNTSGGGGSNFGMPQPNTVSSSLNKPLFGQTSTNSSGSSIPGQSNLFAHVSASNPEPSSSTPSMSGNHSGNSTGLFSLQSNNSSPFQFGEKSASAPKNDTSTSTSSALSFGGSQPANTSLFGGLSTTAVTPSKSFSFASTTPAGPPPNDKPKEIEGSLFNSGSKTSDGSLFSGNTAEQSNSLFGKGNSLSSNSKSSTPTNISAPLQPSKLSFSTQANTNGTSQVMQTSETPKSSGTFNGLTTSAQNSSTMSAKSGLFSIPGNIQAPPSTTSTAPSITASSSIPPFSFSNNLGSKSNPTTAPSTSTNTPATLSNQAPNALSQPATSKPAMSQPAMSQSATSQPATSQPATSQSTTSQSDKSKPNTLTAPTSQAANSTSFGSSTLGPSPQLSRLKNKTMDEIITRWASDLSKYQKEFQEQAGKVAAWDRLMVENGEKIQKLYLSTFEAERKNAEIERQLLNVESQQDEVASWLDKYESEIDEMFSRQVGQGDMLQGPDQEREKIYKLAEKLTDRLDEMGKNLTSMIDAINDASTTLSKNGKADDPLSSIVRVLNNHLTTLQWIDENADELKAKVEEAQKIGKSMGSISFGGPESESADYFYRSLVGRK